MTAPNINDVRAPEGEQSRRKHLRDRLLSLTALGELPPVRPLVSGLLYRDTLVQLAGQPGSYKTFITVGLACSVALGRAWEGHVVPEGGPVVYVAAEGASGIRTRILAWCALAGVDPSELDGRMYVLPAPLQLGDTVDVTEAAEVARDFGALLLVLDTRARCTLGLSENDATEQGHAIAAADTIREAAGCTVLAVHHSGRSGPHGRGSNSWDGAVWSDLQATGEKGSLRVRVHCEKHKEVADGCDHHYRMVPHTVAADRMPRLPGESDYDWTERRSTLVAVQMGALDELAGDARSTQVVLDIVRTMAGAEGLTRPQIVALAEEQNVGRSSAYAAVGTLAARSAIRRIGTESRPRYVVVGGPTSGAGES